MDSGNRTARGRRVALQSVSFSEVRGQIKGFARGWFFWVHQAFKEAMDIRFVKRVDRERTAQLRERVSNELSRLGFAELRRRRNESAEFGAIYAKVMKRSRKMLSETEAILPIYTFRKNDLFESRCGEWQLQITAEHIEEIVGIDDKTTITHAELGIVIYRRVPEQGKRWKPYLSRRLQQPELAQLLKTGSTSAIDLVAAGQEADEARQFDLF